GRRVSRELTRWSDGRPRTSCRAGRPALHFSVQVFSYPVFDPQQRRVQVLERIGYAEAEIAFSVFAERGAREAGNTGLFEQRVGQFLRRPAGLGDVRKHIECALRQAAGEAFDLVQAGDEGIAAALEFSAHFVDRGLVAAQCRNSGNLGEAGGAGGRVGHEARDGHGQIGTHYAVAHAPSGHGVGFGEAVEQNGALFETGYAHDGEVLAFVDEAAVDFVRKNEDVAVSDGLGYFQNIFLGKSASGRVVRRVQDDQLGAVGNQRGQFFDIEGEVALFAEPNGNRLAERIIDHGLVDGEAGIGINDFISIFN